MHEQKAGSVLRSAAIAELREEGDLLSALIALFAAETPRRLALLATAVAAGDCRTAERTAHTLKNTAAVFGADAMCAAAAAAESAARAGMIHDVPQLLAELRIECERVRLELVNQADCSR